MESIKLINKGLIFFTLLCNGVIVVDLMLKTKIYERIFYFKPLHNKIAWLLIIMLVVQIVWLVKGYFSSSKWILYAMMFNVFLFIIQCLYFIKYGDL